MTDTLEAIEQTLVIKPGQHLLVRVHPHTPADQVQHLAEQLRERLPDVEWTVIACDELAVYDPTD